MKLIYFILNIRSNLETSPVILFQDGVFDKTGGLLPVQGIGSTQNHNSTDVDIKLRLVVFYWVVGI